MSLTIEQKQPPEANFKCVQKRNNSESNKSVKTAIFFLLTATVFGQLEAKLGDLVVKFPDKEQWVCDGWGKHQIAVPDEEDPPEIEISYYVTERISVCQYPGGVIVNGFIYELPDAVKQISVKLEDDKLEVFSSEALHSKGFVRQKDVPIPFKTSHRRVPFGVNGKVIDIDVFGYLAGNSATNKDEHTNLATDRITVSCSSVILSFQKGIVSLWGNEIGPCKESVKVDQEKKLVTVDGKAISFENLGIARCIDTPKPAKK